MTRDWILNASPLIVLGKSGLLGEISSLASSWTIPEAVANEVSHKSPIDAFITTLSTKSIVRLHEDIAPQRHVLEWNLGHGESQVISLGLLYNTHCVVLDDLQARKCASLLKVKLIGTVGILVRAKQENIIPSLTVAFDNLSLSGFYLGEDFKHNILASVNEL